MSPRTLIVCCTPFSDTSWKWFVNDLNESEVEWEFHYTVPRGFLETRIRKPNIAMIRTCFEAARSARKKGATMFVSHDPRITFWCAVFLRLLSIDIPHLAWSFNFPELPTGFKRIWMKRAFASIRKFVVFSSTEQKLYAEYFDIPRERFEVVLWGVNPPQPYPETPLIEGGYICAIGGNARDYATLISAIKELPDIKLVLIARSHSIAGLEMPRNVELLVNFPKEKTMNILEHSRFMVLPLNSSSVPCGHVTLVAAMHLGIAFVITNSKGVGDYVDHDVNAVVCPPFDADALKTAISQLWSDPDRCVNLGQNGLKFAREHCCEEANRAALKRMLDGMGLA